MKQFTKQCLAIILTFVMSFALLPPSVATVFAEEMLMLPGGAAGSTIEETTDLTPSTKYLTVYSTTKDFYTDRPARRDQETQSVYMAVSEDGQIFNVLNSGGGVIFSKSGDGTLRVQNPRIYIDNKNAQKPFTVVAPDSDASKGFHVFTSADGVHYYDDTVVKSTELSSVPLNKNDVKLMLNGSDILKTDSMITLGNAVELTDEQYTYIVNKLGTVKNMGLEALSGLKITSGQGAQVTAGTLNVMYPSVNATYTDGSKQNFEIDWTGALEGKDLSKAGSYTLTGKVVQTQYINNLKELNGSTLPDDDPDNTPDKDNKECPDNYDPATGTVYYDKTKYIEGMADPNIYWDKVSGYYYMTASYFPEDGDAIDENDKTDQYDHVVLRRGRTLEELQTRANQVTIWKVGNQGFDDNGTQASKGSTYIWAPEIHRVGDIWVVYFTEGHGGSRYNIYCHALILDGDKDPYETALKSSSQASEWKDYKMRKDESLAADVTDPFATSFCLDMTYFKDEKNGKSYVIWPGKPSIGNTSIYIAAVNEDEPWKITSAATLLTEPEYGWERIRAIVNEGPTVLQHDGNIFVCYSGAGTGSEYAIGMCSAQNGEDLLDADNWKKNPYPLLTSLDVNGEEGPGHNSFTLDKDGNTIFVYHARPTSHNYEKCGEDFSANPLTDPCRHARLKRVHWAADGTPILKMTYEDELSVDNGTVTLNVTVAADGVGTELIKVKGIKLSGDKKLQIAAGKKVVLTAAVTPNNASNKKVNWSVSPAKYAKITGSGSKRTITVNKKGIGKKVTVKATAADGSKKSASVTITIMKGSVKRISFKDKSKTVKAGGKVTLKPTIATNGKKKQTNTKLTWKSSNTKWATVNKSGKVTTKKAGKGKMVTITASSTDGTNKKAAIKTKIKKSL